MKRTPINKVSAKRKTKNAERSKMMKRKREEIGYCEFMLSGCTGRPDDGHELLTRGRGGSITDPNNVRLVCRPCHTYITDHPREADRKGWTIPRWVGPDGVEHADEVRLRNQRGHEMTTWWTPV